MYRLGCCRDWRARRQLVPPPYTALNGVSSSSRMEYSGASRPAWSAPASPRWAASSSTGSELAGGVDGLADVVGHLEFADSSSSHYWPLEWPPAKRLRPIALPGQREPPPLTAPARSLCLSPITSARCPFPLPAVAPLEASDAHELRHAPHPPPPPPTPLSTSGRRDLSQETQGLDWRGWWSSCPPKVREAELVLRTLRPEPERPLPSRIAAKRHKVCESRSPASSTGDCGE